MGSVWAGLCRGAGLMVQIRLAAGSSDIGGRSWKPFSFGLETETGVMCLESGRQGTGRR